MHFNTKIIQPTPRLLAIFFLLGSSASATAQDPWPAEPTSQAINLTSVEGPGSNDFYNDLSGASYDQVAERTWICRNGPWPDSKIWSLVRTGDGSWEIEYRAGLRCEWTGFADLEGLTVAEPGTSRVFGVIEGPDRIREYDLSTPGQAETLHEWDISPWTDAQAGYGAEGIAFVPDTALSDHGFVDGDGLPRTSNGDLGGLMFVAHQQGGPIYAFDLDRKTGAVQLVGRYATSRDETCGLEFDSSTGLLYAWHDAGHDELEVLRLGSSLDPSGGRRFDHLALYDAPFNGTTEGMAISPGADCTDGKREILLTVDDGGADSLFYFREFSAHCDTCSADINGDLIVDAADLGLLLAAWGNGDPLRDFNQDGQVDGADLGLLIGAWGGCP